MHRLARLEPTPPSILKFMVCLKIKVSSALHESFYPSTSCHKLSPMPPRSNSFLKMSHLLRKETSSPLFWNCPLLILRDLLPSITLSSSCIFDSLSLSFPSAFIHSQSLHLKKKRKKPFTLYPCPTHSPPFPAKLLKERCVLVSSLPSPPVKSDFCPHHSTETALAKVTSDPPCT